MTLRKILKLAYPTACAACLAAGYALAGRWVALAPVTLIWLAWLFAKQWSPMATLMASVALAAGGLWLGASPFLMTPAAALALASWDAIHWDGLLGGDLASEIEARLERRHYAFLALALGPALLAAVAGQLIHIQLPFGGLIVIVLLALLSLDRIWSLVKD
jgi:hypothetical protein